MLVLNGKCESKCAQMLCCCDLTVTESAGTLQIILNLKRHFYLQSSLLSIHFRHASSSLLFLPLPVTIASAYLRLKYTSSTNHRLLSAYLFSAAGSCFCNSLLHDVTSAPMLTVFPKTTQISPVSQSFP